jgi:hypothetical protein
VIDLDSIFYYFNSGHENVVEDVNYHILFFEKEVFCLVAAAFLPDYPPLYFCFYFRSIYSALFFVL